MKVENEKKSKKKRTCACALSAFWRRDHNAVPLVQGPTIEIRLG